MSENENASGTKLKVVKNNDNTLPALSAIVFTPDTYETVRRTMQHLKAQTAAGEMEIVIVTPSRQGFMVEESEMACFHSWNVVEYKGETSMSGGYVVGIRNARAPIVALTEDHSFPDANWAEMLVAAHRQPCAAVGPGMRNGNPDTMLSRVDFYHAYSEWANPIASGPVRHLPGHNSSYKRDVLLALGDQLEVLMEAESVLHRHLTAQGHRLLLEAGTCTAHHNFTSWAAWIPLRYHIGRQFAATWAHGWSWRRRLIFLAASPLIPWVRLWRMYNRVRRVHPCSFVIQALLILLLGLLIEWAGQVLGFAAGLGNSREKVVKYESRRFGHSASTR